MHQRAGKDTAGVQGPKDIGEAVGIEFNTVVAD